MEDQHTARCSRCDRAILPATAKATGGICRPCLNAETAARLRAAHEVERSAGIVPLTEEEFGDLALADNHEAACHQVFDKAHWRLSAYGPDALSVGERTLLSVETLFGEVCNGGFPQFLTGETATFLRELPEALLRCGLPEYSRIALKVAQMFPSGVSPELIERTETDLEALTDEFLDLYSRDQNRFRASLHAYIFNHPSEFVRGAGA